MTEEKKSSFKVVDRRRFTDDGDERSGPDVPAEDRVRVDPKVDAPVKTKPETPTPRAPDGNGAPTSNEPPKPVPEGPKLPPQPNALTFSMFLQSLAQQALMQMGLIPWPHGQRELALDQARDTIDIVELLKSKTKGNLDAQEQQLMDTVVYELKMSFVEVQNAIARSRGAQMPKPPGAPR
jgi:hypothetical protein